MPFLLLSKSTGPGRPFVNALPPRRVEVVAVTRVMVVGGRGSDDTSPRQNDGNESSPERCSFNVTSFRERLRDYERTSTNPASAENVQFFRTMFPNLDLN